MQKLSDLMQKDMTRKEFLATLGFGAATIFGFATLLRLITGKDNNPFQQQNSLSYGGGAYGGRKNHS